MSNQNNTINEYKNKLDKMQNLIIGIISVIQSFKVSIASLSEDVNNLRKEVIGAKPKHKISLILFFVLFLAFVYAAEITILQSFFETILRGNASKIVIDILSYFAPLLLSSAYIGAIYVLTHREQEYELLQEDEKKFKAENHYLDSPYTERIESLRKSIRILNVIKFLPLIVVVGVFAHQFMLKSTEKELILRMVLFILIAALHIPLIFISKALFKNIHIIEKFNENAKPLIRKEKELDETKISLSNEEKSLRNNFDDFYDTWLEFMRKNPIECRSYRLRFNAIEKEIIIEIVGSVEFVPGGIIPIETSIRPVEIENIQNQDINTREPNNIDNINTNNDSTIEDSDSLFIDANREVNPD